MAKKMGDISPVAERSITIAGTEVAIPAPYTAGHVLTEGEARVLNQTYGENIRNNVAAKIKAGSTDSAQALTDTYVATYRLGEGGTGGGPRLRGLASYEHDEAVKVLTKAAREHGKSLPSGKGSADAIRQAVEKLRERPVWKTIAANAKAAYEADQAVDTKALADLF